MKPVRTAIYCRYSSDKQSDTSIEDQAHRGREHIRANGGSPDAAQVFSDFAVSGASMDRPGMRALLDAIQRGVLDLVITESVDRISRDIGDADRFRKLLMHHEVALECLDGTRVASGKSDALMFGMRAIFAEQYRLDLADKTRRGLEGRARAGGPTGAVAYGYSIRTASDGTKSVEVDEQQARVVRRLFTMYAAGHSFATIANTLNAEGVAPPRAHARRSGDGWMHSAVRSMLLNERYIGHWTYGEREWVKAPGTNTRRPKARRGGPLLTNERPELALVNLTTWAEVQQRFAGHTRLPQARRSYMLSGLLHCGSCGARMQHNGGSSRPYFACSHAVKRRTCGNRRNVPIHAVEAAALRKICSELAECMGKVREEALAELEVLTRSLPCRRRELEEALTQREHQLARLIDLVATTDSSMAAQRVRALEAERAQIRAELAQLVEAPTDVPSLDDMIEGIESLEDLARAPPDEARELLRAFLLNGKLYCEPVGEERQWRLNWGLLPEALMAGRPSAELLRRPSDTDGCGGLIPAASDVMVVECEVTFAA